MRPLSVATIVTRLTAGAGGVALRGACALDEHRFRATIITADSGSLLGEAEAAGLDIVRLSHLVPELSAGEDARAFAELVRVLSRSDFDIVHTHSAKAGALGRSAARVVGVPAIVHTFHGFPFHEFQSPVRRFAYVAAEQRLARMTDAFLAIGSAVAAEAVRRRIAPVDRVRVIDSAISQTGPTVSRISRFRARQQLEIPPGMHVIGTVARLDYQKAPHDLVAAIAALDRPDVLAVWVGDGPLRDEVADEIRRRDLAQRFWLVGERSDVADLLPAFDVFALSSLYEGLPCALVEAMVCGIPVVATAVNSVHEIVVPGRTGMLVPPRDPARMATALASLLDNSDRAAQLASEARRRLEGRFESADLGTDLMDTYDVAVHAATRLRQPVRVSRTRSRSRYALRSWAATLR
jgi:glycosyltransferase involved in cell wall biosynthesis